MTDLTYPLFIRLLSKAGVGKRGHGCGGADGSLRRSTRVVALAQWVPSPKRKGQPSPSGMSPASSTGDLPQ